MTKAQVGAVALGGVMLVSVAASAQTGNEMLSNCQAALKDPIPQNQMVPAGVCLGYIMGIADGFMYAQIADPKRTAICMPQQGYTNGQGVRVLTKYLSDHPERLNLEVSLLALDAYRNAFPCN